MGQSRIGRSVVATRKDKSEVTTDHRYFHTEPWGIKVSNVEVKQIDLPQEMQRVMAKQAEAERERRSKVIAAEGEFQASQRLADAARILSEQLQCANIKIPANIKRDCNRE